MAVGYAGMTLIHFPYNVPATILFSLATVAILGSWFHDSVHNNIPSPKRASRILARIGSAPVGFSPQWWSYKHVRLHHRYVGNPDFDPDIQFGRVGRVSAAQQWHPMHSTQHIHMWLLLPFATLNMLKPSEMWTARRFRRYKGMGSIPAGWTFLFDKYPPLVLVWMPVVIHQRAENGVLTFIIFQLITGLLVSLVTQVQHNTILADGSTDFSYRWPLCEQLARTTDVGKAWGMWWWLCGGTNLHIVHHLAPSLSFLELPAATERLRHDLAGLGVEYPCHGNLRAAAWSHVLLVKRLARNTE